MYQLEMSCRAQVAVMAAGAEIISPPDEVLEWTAKIFAPGTLRRYGLLEWPAMLRRLEAEQARSGYPHWAQ